MGCENAFSKLSLSEQTRLYTEKAHPGTLLTKRIGSSYTASCYTNLFSLLAGPHPNESHVSAVSDNTLKPGETILVYSYGSGSASALFRLRYCGGGPNLGAGPYASDVSRVPHIHSLLDQRQRHDPASYVQTIEAFSNTYGRFDFCPEQSTSKQPGAFFISKIDRYGKREYAECDAIDHGADMSSVVHRKS